MLPQPTFLPQIDIFMLMYARREVFCPIFLLFFFKYPNTTIRNAAHVGSWSDFSEPNKLAG